MQRRRPLARLRVDVGALLEQSLYQLDFDSPAGQGTRLQADFPLDRP